MRSGRARTAIKLDRDSGAGTAKREKFVIRILAGEDAVGDQPEPAPDRPEAKAVRHLVEDDVGKGIEAHGIHIDDVELHGRGRRQRARGPDRGRPGLAEDAIEAVDVAEFGGNDDVVDVRRRATAPDADVLEVADDEAGEIIRRRDEDII